MVNNFQREYYFTRISLDLAGAYPYELYYISRASSHEQNLESSRNHFQYIA
jgi:hypothetical protein